MEKSTSLCVFLLLVKIVELSRNDDWNFWRYIRWAYKHAIIKIVNDILIATKSEEENIKITEQILARCTEKGISLNPLKCMYGKSE